MIKVQQNLGVSGEFQVIVRRADGSIKLDTGMQPNLILDNGLKFYLHLPMTLSNGVQFSTQSGSSLPHFLMYHCAVGSGNAEPRVGDIVLQHLEAFATANREDYYGVELPSTGNHENYVKAWYRRKFIFDNIRNKNITEVGLVPFYGTNDSTSNVYTLATRALIKDTQGTPISVTVLEGEILEVIYQINLYGDLRRQTGEFTLTRKVGSDTTVETYEYFMQPYADAYGGNVPNYLWYSPSYHKTVIWGVKESDDELDASYSLEHEDYTNITHLTQESLRKKVAGNVSTSTDRNKYSSDYCEVQLKEASFETKSATYITRNGIYTGVFPNGIRAFTVGVGQSSTDFLVGLVVVKNKANGQGIKKTNRQIWEYEHTYTIGRWEE